MLLTTPDVTVCSTTLTLLPKESRYVKETPGMQLFWEEMSIDPDHPHERCPYGRNAHYGRCYEAMITAEVRSTAVCQLEPQHSGQHAADIGFCNEIVDKDMWITWEVGVPGSRKISQPGECPFFLADPDGRSEPCCMLPKGHPGRHNVSELGFVGEDGLNRYGVRPAEAEPVRAHPRPTGGWPTVPAVAL